MLLSIMIFLDKKHQAIAVDIIHKKHSQEISKALKILKANIVIHIMKYLQILFLQGHKPIDLV